MFINLAVFINLGAACDAEGGSAGEGEGEGEAEGEGEGEGDGEGPICEPATQQGPSQLPAGIEYCGQLNFNSTDAVACSADANPRPCDVALDGDQGECTTDAGCSGGARCLPAAEGCACFELCETDADCVAGEACVCTAAVTDSAMIALASCVPADCRTAADCPSGECGVGVGGCDPRAYALLCRSADDECRYNADCANSADLCTAVGSEWLCEPPFTCF